jgi:hypothetical protein
VGIYTDGQLFYENFPDNLSRTWRYTGSLQNQDIEYAWLWGNGQTLEQACPSTLVESYKSAQKRFQAYLKSFQLGKINIREHCIFDLVPEDFLMQFCDIKNKITEHVFATYEKPDNYDHLLAVDQLLYKIKYQKLNLNNENCRELYYSSRSRAKANELIENYTYVDYNLFGTVTGRLTTRKKSFPILTVKKEFRKLLKPNNEWFLSLDYNAAEARTFLALAGHPQPNEDIHAWNMKNVYHDSGETATREDAKVRFFAWLYDPNSDDVSIENVYDKQKVLDLYYKEGYINTTFGRSIRVESPKALNYLIQSTTADLVLERAVAMDKFLEDHKSFVSHIVHDEIVVDLADDERDLVPHLKELFSANKLDQFQVNLSCGFNYYDLKELKI